MGIFGKISEIFRKYAPTEEETRIFREKRLQNIQTGDISEYDFIKLEISVQDWTSETINYYKNSHNILISEYIITIDNVGNLSFFMIYRALSQNSKVQLFNFTSEISKYSIQNIKKKLSENNFLGFKIDEIYLYIDGYHSKGSSLCLNFENEDSVCFGSRDYTYGRYDILLQEIKNILDFDNFFQNILSEIKDTLPKN